MSTPVPDWIASVIEKQGLVSVDSVEKKMNELQPTLEEALHDSKLYAVWIDPYGRLVTRCDSCSAMIFFAETVKGRNMPLDAQPAQAGNVQLGFIGGYEYAIVVGDPAFRAAAVVDGIPLWMPHFATCPRSLARRKPRDPS